MAKKKKDEEEEVYKFTPPKFDEKVFMRNEIKKGKTTHFTILLGALMGIISVGLTYLNQRGLAVLFGFMVLVSFKNYFNLVRVDFTFFEKKDWFGAGGTYIFTWVVVWTLLMNPPFSDFSSPAIKRIVVYGIDDEGNWTAYGSGNADTLIMAGENIRINATVTDNIGVKSVELVFNDSIARNSTGPVRDGDTYTWILENMTAGEHFVSIISEDENGHKGSRDYTFEVNADEFKPQVLDADIYGQDAVQTWVEYTTANQGTLIDHGEDVQVNASITDNVGLRSVQLIIQANSLGNYSLASQTGNYWVWLLENVTAGQHNFTLRAEDLSGQVTARQYTILVN